MFDCNKTIKKCKAVCCYYVPLPKELWEKYKQKAQAEVKVFKWDEGYVLPLTKNMRCPFVGKDYKCVIYPHRPWLCQYFGKINTKGLKCFWLKANGNKRGKDKKRKLEQENYENLMRIKKRIEDEFSK